MDLAGLKAFTEEWAKDVVESEVLVAGKIRKGVWKAFRQAALLSARPESIPVILSFRGSSIAFSRQGPLYAY